LPTTLVEVARRLPPMHDFTARAFRKFLQPARRAAGLHLTPASGFTLLPIRPAVLRIRSRMVQPGWPLWRHCHHADRPPRFDCDRTGFEYNYRQRPELIPASIPSRRHWSRQPATLTRRPSPSPPRCVRNPGNAMRSPDRISSHRLLVEKTTVRRELMPVAARVLQHLQPSELRASNGTTTHRLRLLAYQPDPTWPRQSGLARDRAWFNFAVRLQF